MLKKKLKYDLFYSVIFFIFFPPLLPPHSHDLHANGKMAFNLRGGGGCRIN
jgi:hypothetical protein